MMAGENPQITPVDPARLDTGKWCHRTERQIGEGDISASYSADTIGMQGRTRKPFTWNGASWVCVSISGRAGSTRAKAYRLVQERMFDGEALTYNERVRAKRSPADDDLGFYHGMLVKSGAEKLVLCGPPRTFVRGKTEQLSLF